MVVAVPAEHAEIVGRFASIIGEANVLVDSADIAYFSQDYFQRAEPAVAVLRPADAAELAKVVAATTEAGLAVYPRGGGYSYTSGYLTTKPGVVIDLKRMDKIIRIAPEDMYVTVEPGCTWATLHAALAEHGLRTPFFGPFSGLRATVGGSISQGSISLGSSKYGVSSESVLDLEIVTAEGEVLKTGVSGQPNHPPFFRNYGPDLTGLFCSDCGALGIKSSITLKLIRQPTHWLGLSFGFGSFAAMTEAAAAVAKEGIVADNMGMPAAQVLASVEHSSLSDNLKLLWKVANTGAGFFDGVLRAAKIAVSGARFLRGIEQTFNVVVEGPSRRSVNAQAETVRQAVGSRGVEIPNTVPTAMRADPFLEYDMLSPTGQRQLPPSTILPFSAVVALSEAFDKAVAGLMDEMAPFGMTVMPVIATVGTNGCLVEPVIAWNDAADVFHQRHSSERVLKLAADHDDSPAARDLAARVRQRFIELAYEHGGVHLQIGKVYPYLSERDRLSVALLKDIKRRVDPRGLMNPGALGLSA